MIPFGGALILTALYLFSQRGKAEEVGELQQAHVSSTTLVFADFTELFGGQTMKMAALGNCDSAVKITMDTSSGLSVEYSDNDIAIMQTGDIGRNMNAGPFMYFATKSADRFTVQSYLDESTVDGSGFSHPQLVYFEGNVAGNPLEWPAEMSHALCSPLCNSGELLDLSKTIL